MAVTVGPNHWTAKSHRSTVGGLDRLLCDYATGVFICGDRLLTDPDVASLTALGDRAALITKISSAKPADPGAPINSMRDMFLRADEYPLAAPWNYELQGASPPVLASNGIRMYAGCQTGLIWSWPFRGTDAYKPDMKLYAQMSVGTYAFSGGGLVAYCPSATSTATCYWGGWMPHSDPDMARLEIVRRNSGVETVLVAGDWEEQPCGDAMWFSLSADADGNVALRLVSNWAGSPNVVEAVDPAASALAWEQYAGAYFYGENKLGDWWARCDVSAPAVTKWAKPGVATANIAGLNTIGFGEGTGLSRVKDHIRVDVATRRIVRLGDRAVRIDPA